MRYQPVALPFLSRTIAPDTNVAISASGDFAFLDDDALEMAHRWPEKLPLEMQALLQSRFFLTHGQSLPGVSRLLASRVAAKSETIKGGPSLHILVPTLQCEHSCKYCQVSRSLDDQTHAMSESTLHSACDSIFESQAPSLTVEFQGGDPLLRFDLVRDAILRITGSNKSHGRQLRFVVASTLHQLNEEMCAFFKEHGVYLSTSVDGPEWLHNKNRPTRTRDSHARTMAGIELARKRISPDSVSALMTTTRESLRHPEAIVDEYVRLGFQDIFIRPLSSYGFARRNQSLLGYKAHEFHDFYVRALERVLHWNRTGVSIREVYASIILNKMLSTFDGGYVDLQSPTGAGSSVLVYNYDGFVYPSDEARMLAETGDTSMRMGRIGQPLSELLDSPVRKILADASTVESARDCSQCAYNRYCAPNPVDAQAQFGNILAPAHTTEHCQRHIWLFDHWFLRVNNADRCDTALFHSWAAPTAAKEASCAQ